MLSLLRSIANFAWRYYVLGRPGGRGGQGFFLQPVHLLDHEADDAGEDDDKQDSNEIAPSEHRYACFLNALTVLAVPGGASDNATNMQEKSTCRESVRGAD